jgi:tRNA G18 (ribose-2'-O)-methylase SpoU
MVYAVEQVEKSIHLQNFKTKKGEKIALIFGNEVYGVEQEVINVCDGSIEIPQLGTKHSLNISVSIGVVIWEVAKSYF